jgi:DNA polymerase III subunit delta
MPMANATKTPPVIVIAGDEEYQKECARRETLDRLLPPEVDRTLALTVYDGSLTPEQGGPELAAVMDDLNTLPFLTDRRVVLIREADKFISAQREVLERYAAAPSATSTLILECRTFPKTTRLYKALTARSGASQSPGTQTGGLRSPGEIVECKKLSGRALIDFVFEEARARGKSIDASAAGQLVGLIGPDQGQLASEVEKLALYALDRHEISASDVLEGGRWCRPIQRRCSRR